MDNDRNVSELRNELNSLDKTKEEYFGLSKSNRAKLNELRGKVQTLKNERNKLTDSVKKIKVERDALNKTLKEKIEAFKKIAPKKVEKPKEHVNVGFLRKEIKAMEYKIETEGLDFDKEQKLMKIIKEKKKLVDSAGPAKLSSEAKLLSNEIDAIRAKADEIHKNMQVQAAESQKKHEEVIKLSNELKEIEAKQKEIDDKCKEFKAKVHDVNEKLKGQLDKAILDAKEHPIQHKENRKERRKKEFGKEKEHRHNHTIEELQRKVEEKIRKGEKLTTDDLRVYQAKR
ncbi:hypothetical protein JXB27_01025 [Candidatus Woesearchaeota archaeon]|nr:hypothetical protein [Candidatus Woesearchaeota archaeon]